MTNYTCARCGIHKNTAGHRVCHDCLEKEIRSLSKRLGKAEAKLSEYENGLPVEKAKEGRLYAALIFRGHQNPSFLICQAFKSPLDQKIRFQIACGQVYEGENIMKLIPLPSLPSQTQEGS